MTVTSNDPRASRPWCLFRIGTRAYAIGLEAVAEIIEAGGLVRLPLSPACVLGLCSFRRDVVPVVRLVEEPADAPGGDDARQTILILRTEQGTWGVKIERGGTVVVEAPLDDSVALTAEPAGLAFLGAIRRAGMTYPAVDPERTWRRLREAVERSYGSLHDRPPPRPGETAPRASEGAT
jgi:CheW-like domain